MDFQFTPIQLLTQRSVRRFAKEQLAVIAPRLDREHQAHPKEVIDQLAAQNLYGIQVPEEYEGAGLDSISYCLAIEEISKACAATGLMVTVHNSVVALPIATFGTDDQKRRYLADLASGRKIGAFSITEPNAGSDVSGMQTVAVKDGSDYVLNGMKCFVTNGAFAETCIIGATVDRTAGNKGVALFLVEKAFPGVSVGKIERKMGMRANPVSELFFDNVRVPKENVLGKLTDGFKLSMKILDMGRIGIAAQSLGIGMAAFEAAARYATERKQFNQPIGEFQAIKFKLAEMKASLESARYLIYKAADLKGHGLPYSEASAMAKYVAAENAMKACTDAMQIFGGYGYVEELPVERYFRDCKITQIYEGTSEIMQIIIGNAILKEFSGGLI
nr:acyl-CoA dehydrogenase family protein [Candidatus Sigynarchaeum springense]